MNLNEHFEACAGKLGSLPSNYKKWKPGQGALEEYRNEWSFIQKKRIRERIAEADMTFDYLWSLNEWLKPEYLFKNMHNLLCVTIVSSIYDAALFDWITREIKDEKVCKWLALKMSANERLDFVKEKGLFEKKEARQYFKEMNELRNLIHLTKIDPTSQIKLRNIEPEILREHINWFRTFLKGNY